MGSVGQVAEELFVDLWPLGADALYGCVLPVGALVVVGRNNEGDTVAALGKGTHLLAPPDLADQAREQRAGVRHGHLRNAVVGDSNALLRSHGKSVSHAQPYHVRHSLKFGKLGNVAAGKDRAPLKPP